MAEMCPTCERDVEPEQLTICDSCCDEGCEKCMPTGLCDSCLTAEQDLAAARNPDYHDFDDVDD